MERIIDLSNAILIGEGDHKKSYVDPTDSSRCIKILFTTHDVDMERELKYRRSRERRNLPSRLLPAYYGTVETNMGKGYVFERVADFDGKSSRTFQNIFDKADSDKRLIPFVEEMMKKFKQLLFEELIVTSNVESSNFLVQRASETKFSVRIIDNIGSPVFFPLAYYFDFFARRHLQKYWKRFLKELQEDHPAVMTDALKRKLM